MLSDENACATVCSAGSYRQALPHCAQNWKLLAEGVTMNILPGGLTALALASLHIDRFESIAQARAAVQADSIRFRTASTANRKRVTFLARAAAVMFHHVSALRTPGSAHCRAGIHALEILVEFHCKIQCGSAAIRADDPLARRAIGSRHDALGADTLDRRRPRRRISAYHRHE